MRCCAFEGIIGLRQCVTRLSAELSLMIGIYRREQWHIPLAAALTDLVECCNRLKLTQVNLPPPAYPTSTPLACNISEQASIVTSTNQRSNFDQWSWASGSSGERTELWDWEYNNVSNSVQSWSHCIIVILQSVLLHCCRRKPCICWKLQHSERPSACSLGKAWLVLPWSWCQSLVSSVSSLSTIHCYLAFAWVRAFHRDRAKKKKLWFSELLCSPCCP